MPKSYKIFFAFMIVVVIAYLIPGLTTPLQGVHEWRQADTMFASYFYCTEEGVEFLKPKIGPRGETAGVAIGEFPLYSYLMSLKCKATGSWDEVTPKLVSYLILFLLIWSWGVYFYRRFGKDQPRDPWVWTALFLFAPISLAFLTLPIPDGFALLLYSAIAHLWLRSERWAKILGVLIFPIAFTIRPYYFPLLFLITDSIFLWGASLFLAGLAYLFWFKYWVYQSDLKQYYETELHSVSALMHEIPRALPEMIGQLFRDHWNFFGVVFFWKGFRDNKRLSIVWLISLALIIGLRGDHFVVHKYYLLGAAVLGFYIMYRGYWKTSPRYRNALLALMAVAGIVSVQHLWLTASTKANREIREMSLATTAPTDKVAAFLGPSPAWLYFTLRTGWVLSPETYVGPKSCPAGANFALIRNQDQYQFIPCEKN